jgi:hypothetical protein
VAFRGLVIADDYSSWLARKLRPHVGDAVLELGAGIGNIAGRLMGRRSRSSRRPSRPGKLLRYGALPECARIPGGSRLRGEPSPRHLETGRRAEHPGAVQRGIQ